MYVKLSDRDRQKLLAILDEFVDDQSGFADDESDLVEESRIRKNIESAERLAVKLESAKPVYLHSFRDPDWAVTFTSNFPDLTFELYEKAYRGEYGLERGDNRDFEKQWRALGSTVSTEISKIPHYQMKENK